MVASIILDTSMGPVGTTVEITGSGFAMSEAIDFTYLGNPVNADDGPITSDGIGGFVAHYTIPASPTGANAITATDQSAGTDSKNFTVQPTVTITEASANVGDTINLTGTGYAASEAISLQFNSASATPVSPITTDADGSFTGQLVVPAAPQGTRTLDATDVSMNTDSDTITVNQLITLSLNHGPYGTTVTVTGSGFAASSSTTIEANGNDVTGAALTTSSVGAFSRAVTIPDMPEGTNNIVATDASMNDDTKTFTMEPSIEINPASGEVSSDIAIIIHGFTASESIAIRVNGGLAAQPTAVASDADGTGAGVFTIPVAAITGSNTVSATDETGINATTTITIIEAIGSPENNGPNAERKLVSGLYKTPVISVDGANMTLLLSFDARNYEKGIVQIQNLDDTDDGDFNLFGSLDPSGPSFDTATWTQILTSDVQVAKGATKTLNWSDPYYWIVVAGKKHSGDAESECIIYARGINTSRNS